ncbi:MAG: DUF4143 domain-containing protein [bacterium]|nr:DUF4143 domain-containing protein [bacterium]
MRTCHVCSAKGGSLLRCVHLEGKTPRLIDEWQSVPEIWNRVRRAVDDRKAFGQFILTGSAQPRDDAMRHSGAGRISRLRMYTLSTFESGHSTGSVSMAALLKGETISTGKCSQTFDDLVDSVVTGGWPANLQASVSTTMRRVRDYLVEAARIDVAQPDLTSRGKDPRKVGAVIQSLARGVGSSMSLSTIREDLSQVSVDISERTVESYLDALQRAMLIEFVPAWTVHLRSRARLRTKPKHYFADPSLAAAALKASPKHLRDDLRLLGLLFENLVMRDLLVYAQHNDATISFYRDNNGLEVDAIVEQHDGAWIAIEIKLGANAVDDAAATLQRFVGKVDTDRKGEPAALVVITGNGYHYPRTDGVSVVPFGVLGP